MQVGNLHQKASPYVSMFVLACCVIVTGLLFVLQKAEALQNVLYSDAAIVQYLD